MLNLFNFSEGEKKLLLKSLTILIDRREKINSHLTDWFNKKGIKYVDATLDYCDYSFVVPANSELGISRDLYFDKQIVIERKANLVELSGNLSHDRQRFEDEFLRSGTCKKYLLIESGSYDDILVGKYKTDLSPVSYFASLLTFNRRYNLEVVFINPENAAQFIYAVFYYYLRELIK
jgi:hypothetical protein